ncbi:MAG: hypothetical protein AAF927_18490 [Bacteroidota bacterium]
MKKLILTSLLSALCLSLFAQKSPPAFKHQLSLNFTAPFNGLRRIFSPANAGVLFIPGIEYRFRFNDRITGRLGGGYSPSQLWKSGEPDGSLHSQVQFSAFGVSAGAQYHFGLEAYIPNFQFYTFGELGGSTYRDEYTINNLSNTPSEIISNTTISGLGASFGLGITYILRQRIVFCYETAYSFSISDREIINPSATTPILNLRSSAHTFIPINEFSIGWRF